MCTYSWPDSSLIALITCSVISCLALPGGPAVISGGNLSGAPILTSIRPGRGTTRSGGSTPPGAEDRDRQHRQAGLERQPADAGPAAV